MTAQSGLEARSRWGRAGVGMTTLLLLGRRSRAHVVRRRGLSVDSRWLAPSPEAGGMATVHVHLRGQMATSDGRVLRRPALHVLAENEFDRVDGAGGTFVSTGDEVVVMDITLPAAHVRGAVGLLRGERPLSEATWSAIQRIAADNEETALPRYRDLLRGLVTDGVLTAAALDGIDDDEPAHLRRLWGALSGSFAQQDTGAALKALLGLMHVSPRQVARDLDELRDRCCFLGGFRATLRVMRLRRAMTLLSAPALSLNGVAREVGYGSVAALARGLRDAGLPPPSTIRQRWLDEVAQRASRTRHDIAAVPLSP